MADEQCPYVSRGGLKLAAALEQFAVDPTGMLCADLGANVGGFTDCLLQRGAAKVFAVDTGYGTLAWKLRQDDRVTVLERSNALHLDPAEVAGFSPCQLVTIDLGWTRQAFAVPAALTWLDHGPTSRVITLIKPHYEAPPTPRPGRGKSRRSAGVLSDEQAETVMRSVLAQMPEWGVQVVDVMVSPIRGGAGKGKAGNREYLALLKRLET